MPTWDLTHRLDAGTQVYPGDPPVSLSPHARMDRDGYRVTELSLGTHAGTHVDAPAHTEPDGKTLDEFPVDAFRFDARIVDLTGLAPRTAVTRDHFPAPACEMLVLHTGWDRHWGSDRYRDHPYLAPETAAWLAAEGYHVGMDCFSPDPTPSENATADEPDGVPAHHALLGADRLVLENLTGLDAVPDRCTVRAYPLRVDADGAPVRAVADV